MKKTLLKEKFNWLVLLTGFLSFCLIFYQFLFRRGFWLDELNLADVVFSESFLSLLKPLVKTHQVTPIMFLWVEKVLLMMADIVNKDWSDYFLRIYPFLCGLGVVLLYYKLVLKLTDNKYVALVAYALLVLNPRFIYYSSEIKRYICELFYTILLLYVWLKKSEEGWNKKNTALFLLVVLLSVFNTSTICFVLLPMGLYDGWQLFKNHNWSVKALVKSKDTLFYVLRYAVSLISLFGYYFLFLYKHPIYGYMQDFWIDSFVNSENYLNVIKNAFNWYFPLFNIQVCFLGFLCLLAYKKKQAFVLSLFVVLSHAIFSHFELYPLFKRFILYWMAFLPICMASLFFFIYDSCFKTENVFKKRVFVMLFVVGVFCCFAVRLNQLPIYLYHTRYLKETLSLIEKEYKEGDVIFTQSFYPKHPYLDKYYSKMDISNKLIDIKTWENLSGFLDECNKRQSVLENVNRLWVLPSLKDANPDAVAQEINRNKNLLLSGYDLVFCKKTDVQVWCLLERGGENTTARVDLNTPYFDEQQFRVFVDEKELKEESWMSEYNLRGFVFQKRGTEGSIKIVALNDREINLSFKGPWKAPFGKALERWVDYTSIKINGKDILFEKTPTWHNQPFVYTINAKKGKEYIIDVKWKNHTQEEFAEQ